MAGGPFKLGRAKFYFAGLLGRAMQSLHHRSHRCIALIEDLAHACKTSAIVARQIESRKHHHGDIGTFGSFTHPLEKCEPVHHGHA